MHVFVSLYMHVCVRECVADYLSSCHYKSHNLVVYLTFENHNYMQLSPFQPIVHLLFSDVGIFNKLQLITILSHE